MTKQDKITYIRSACIEANPQDFGKSYHSLCGKKLCTCEEGNKHRLFSLAGILLAIRESAEQGSHVSYIEKKSWNTICFWNLKQDDLVSQSPETIDFIYSLLKKETI